MLPRHFFTVNRLSIFNGQSFAPPGTTTTDNSTPRFSGHPFSKAMGSGTLDSTGLICSFHRYNLFPFCIPLTGIANKKTSRNTYSGGLKSLTGLKNHII